MEIHGLNLIDILNLICSIVAIFTTIFIACRVQKSIVSNHAKTKQVEKMSELVEYLNQNRFKVYSLYNAGFENNGLSYNIFEIAYLDKNPKTDVSGSLNLDEMNSAKVYLTANSNYIIDIEKYLYDGFIPKEVASCLKKFYIIKVGEEKLYNQLNEDESVCINTAGNIIDGVNIKVKQICSSSIRNWFDLKGCAKELTSEISNWFKDNGIKEWNMRIDYEKRS